MSLNTYCLNKSTSDPHVQGPNNLNELHIHIFMHTRGLVEDSKSIPRGYFHRQRNSDPEGRIPKDTVAPLQSVYHYTWGCYGNLILPRTSPYSACVEQFSGFAETLKVRPKGSHVKNHRGSP